jgi:hypothetical protein
MISPVARSRWRAFFDGVCRTFSFGMGRDERPPVLTVEQQFVQAFDDLDVAIAATRESERWKTLLERLEKHG